MNKWINEAMNSLDGMQPAPPRGSVFDRIERRLQNGIVATKTIPLYKVSLAAASILLLFIQLQPFNDYSVRARARSRSQWMLPATIVIAQH